MNWGMAVLALVFVAAPVCPEAVGAPGSLDSLPALDLESYAGAWYQVAWIPNRFQRQCATDTMALYRSRPDGNVDVLNRCRRSDGAIEQAQGVARPAGVRAGAVVRPARLEVSFLPSYLRWLPVGWGRYWVIQHPPDGRYAVVSEPSREYLWVLSRTPELSPADDSAIRSRLREQGFDLSRVQSHPHSNPLP